jgi:hypothetical protein
LHKNHFISIAGNQEKKFASKIAIMQIIKHQPLE